MKVKELIEHLKKEDPEALVVLSKDREGNYYSPLKDIDNNMAYDEYREEVGLFELTPGLREGGYDEEDVVEGVKCIVLWP